MATSQSIQRAITTAAKKITGNALRTQKFSPYVLNDRDNLKEKYYVMILPDWTAHVDANNEFHDLPKNIKVKGITVDIEKLNSGDFKFAAKIPR